jgi:hypothetical protein
MLLDKFNILTVLATFAVVVIAVLSHYEGLRLFTRWIGRTSVRPRLRIALLIYGLLLLHSLEIWIFGVSYWLFSLTPGFGSLVSTQPLYILDYVYFSATVYSTLGFGDLVPTGPLRFMAGMESVTGLLMITWSASFTYLEMVQFWRTED